MKINAWKKISLIVISILILIILFSLFLNFELERTLEIDLLESKLVKLAIQKNLLDASNAKDDEYFTKNWFLSRKNGRWTEGKSAEIRFLLTNPFLLDQIVSLTLHGVWTLRCSNDNQSITAFINGKNIGTKSIVEGSSEYTYPIKRNLLHIGWNIITLNIKESCSPYSLNMNQDVRQLGAFLSKITLDYKNKSITNSTKTDEIKKYNNEKYFLIPTNSEIKIYLPYGKNHTINFDLGIDCDSSHFSKDNIIFTIKAFTSNKSIQSRPYKLSCDKKNKFQSINLNVNDSKAQVPIITIQNYGGLESEAKPLISQIKVRFKEEGFKKKPNIILMSFDALRYDHISYAGYYRDTTPNLDRLASNSLFYRSAYSQAPFTIHSIASLLTGKYPFWDPHKKLPKQYKSIAEIMKMNSYSTILVSQTPWLSDFFDITKGFDYVIKSHPYDESRDNKVPLKNLDIASSILQELPRIINEGKPFFLYMHLMPPHAPYIPPEPFRSKYRSQNLINPLAPLLLELSLDANKLSNHINKEILQDLIDQYDGNISFGDYQLGNFIKLLNELNLMNSNIVLILTADHGEEFMDHNNLLHSETLYEELIHVPLLIYYPDRFVKGKKIDRIAELIDIAATILEIIGDNPKKYSLDGESLIPDSPEFHQNKKAYSVLWQHNAYAVIEKDKKIIVCLTGKMGVGNGRHNCSICVINFNRQKKELCEEPVSNDDIHIANDLKSWINQQKNKIISLQQEEVKLPQEEQEKLKALGYAK